MSLILIIHKEARTCVTGRAGSRCVGGHRVMLRHECFCTPDAPNRPNLRVKALGRFPCLVALLRTSSRAIVGQKGPGKNLNSSEDGPDAPHIFHDPILCPFLLLPLCAGITGPFCDVAGGPLVPPVPRASLFRLVPLFHQLLLWYFIFATATLRDFQRIHYPFATPSLVKVACIYY